MSRAPRVVPGDLGYPLFVPSDPPTQEDQLDQVGVHPQTVGLAQVQVLQPLQSVAGKQSAAGALVGISGNDRVDAVPRSLCVVYQGKAAAGQLAHVPLGGIHHKRLRDHVQPAQLGQLLRVGLVVLVGGLGDYLEVVWVRQQGVDACGLQRVVQDDPVVAGGFADGPWPAGTRHCGASR